MKSGDGFEILKNGWIFDSDDGLIIYKSTEKEFDKTFYKIKIFKMKNKSKTVRSNYFSNTVRSNIYTLRLKDYQLLELLKKKKK